MQYLKRTILDFFIVAKEFIVIKASCLTGGMYETARIAVDGKIRAQAIFAHEYKVRAILV